MKYRQNWIIKYMIKIKEKKYHCKLYSNKILVACGILNS